jgi:hypothetical protein
MLSTLYLLFGATVAHAASPLAGRSQGIEKRSIVAGFAVQTTNCPARTSACQSHWCCPDTLTCSVMNDTTVDNVCCNGSKLSSIPWDRSVNDDAPGDDCFDPLAASPVCADSSWGLFLATTAAPFNGDPGVSTFSEFRSLPGQVRTINAECLDPEAVPAGQGAFSVREMLIQLVPKPA